MGALQQGLPALWDGLDFSTMDNAQRSLWDSLPLTGSLTLYKLLFSLSDFFWLDLVAQCPFRLLLRPLQLIGQLLNILYKESHKVVTVVKSLFVPLESCVVGLLSLYIYLNNPWLSDG